MITTYTNRDKYELNDRLYWNKPRRPSEGSERLTRTGKGAAQGTPAGNQHRENGKQQEGGPKGPTSSEAIWLARRVAATRRSRGAADDRKGGV